MSRNVVAALQAGRAPGFCSQMRHRMF